ncbi:MAG: polymer-forming cytoskeletal protein [Gammaproteobacteria bacterium]|nr:MAG: polymer-forming cytoskeletal protein [Gammaproteobacteria bacterium]RLA59381.1 MAG: polymer-forming cytoskeletal protein [Gammaproteobacteria bacterium]
MAAMTMFERNKNKQAAPPATDPVIAQPTSASVTPATARSVAMIGPSIKIKGEVTGDEDLVIQGKVEGTIELSDHEVSVGQSGQVFADIKAKVIKIDGEVTGDIAGNEKVVISKSGNVRGNIVAPRVTLEDGAIFKGSIDMDPGDNSSGKLSLTSQQPANSPTPDIKSPGLDLKSG